jgi:hypothetical protein
MSAPSTYKRMRGSILTNPRRLPWAAWVCDWWVSYHRTPKAAWRAAKREAARAARQSGGPPPQAEVRRVVFDDDAP